MNPDISSYLRELAGEFNLSPNALKEELDGLSGAGYLSKEKQGRYIYYKANTKHPFFPEIHSIVCKHLGIDRIVEQILNHLGKVEAVYILDDYARGIDSGIIDVLIVGDVDEQKVVNVAKPIEKKLARKVRTMTMTAAELETLRDTILSRPNLKVL